MKVELPEEAQVQVQPIDSWWRENRRATLLAHALVAATALLPSTQHTRGGEG